MGESDVKLLGSCLRPFASRVRIALRLKSVNQKIYWNPRVSCFSNQTLFSRKSRTSFMAGTPSASLSSSMKFGLMVLLKGALRKLSKGKAFFGGDNIGYLDIALGPIYVLIGLSEKFTGAELPTEADTPSLLRWTHGLSSHAAVKGLLPEPDKFVCRVCCEE